MDDFKFLEKFSKSSDLPISVFEGRNLVFKGHKDKQDYGMPMFLLECLPHDLPDIWVGRTPENLFFGGLLFGRCERLLMIGPVSANECSVLQCERTFGRLGGRLREAGALQKVINGFAPCDVSHLRNCLKLLNYVLNGTEDAEVSGIDFKWKDLFFDAEEYLIEMPPETEDDAEELMMAFIRNGKVKELEVFLNEKLFRMGSSTDKISRNINERRNYIIGANTLISRMAIQEGVDARMAKTLAGYYLDLLMRTENLKDLDEIFYKLAVDYTKRIGSTKNFVSEDMLSRRVNGYVQAHLYGKLGTAVIAKAFHINEAYLCEEFKKATGQTVTRFIQACKIREDRFLLEKGHSPTEVSVMLAFSSPSYFGSVFKKIMGMTPMEYRKSVD